MSIVDKELQEFQKAMWSSDKPLHYAIVVVERLMSENKRMRTVMLEALHQIDENLSNHLSEDNGELFKLLDNLCLKRFDLYQQHLSGKSREDVNEELRKKLDFSNLENS